MDCYEFLLEITEQTTVKENCCHLNCLNEVARFPKALGSQPHQDYGTGNAWSHSYPCCQKPEPVDAFMGLHAFQVF